MSVRAWRVFSYHGSRGYQGIESHQGPGAMENREIRGKILIYGGQRALEIDKY